MGRGLTKWFRTEGRSGCGNLGVVAKVVIDRARMGFVPAGASAPLVNIARAGGVA
jgi:hypothetical protein